MTALQAWFIQTRDNPKQMAYLVLGIALMAASFASVFMRLAQVNGSPSLLIVAGRLSLAALILTPFVLRQYGDELRQLTRRDITYAALAGLGIAIHFTLLVFALENTKVVMVQVIVGTGAVWTAFMEVVFLRARLNRMVWMGIGAAFVGGIVIALTSPASSTEQMANPALGNLLAVGAAIAGSVYLTLGRKVRAKVSSMPYIWMVFGFGALIGSTVFLLSGTPIFGHGPDAYFWIVMIALVPQLIGHSGFNYAMGALTATVVTLFTQIVVVSTGILAFLIFAQVPTWGEFAGSLVIISGVILAITGQSKRKLRRKPKA